MHIASSAMNRRILDLEDEIGFPLFERLPRGVRATAAGELFLVYVRRSLKELRQLEAQIDGSARARPRSRADRRRRIGDDAPLAGRHRGLSGPSPRDRLRRDGRRPGALADAAARGRRRPDLHALADSRSRHRGAGFGRAAAVRAGRRRNIRWRHARASACTTASPIPSPCPTRRSPRGHSSTPHCAAPRSPSKPALVSNSVETTKIFARTRQGVCFSFHIGHEADVSGMVAIPLSDPVLADTRLEFAGRRGRVLPVAAASFAEEVRALFEKL